MSSRHFQTANLQTDRDTPLLTFWRICSWPCIRGHRAGSCSHAGDRPMMPVRRPGRPLTSCPHLPSARCDCRPQATTATSTAATTPNVNGASVSATATETAALTAPPAPPNWPTATIDNRPQDPLFPQPDHLVNPTLSLLDLDLLTVGGTVAAPGFGNDDFAEWIIQGSHDSPQVPFDLFTIDGTATAQQPDSHLQPTHEAAAVDGAHIPATQEGGEWWLPPSTGA